MDIYAHQVELMDFNGSFQFYALKNEQNNKSNLDAELLFASKANDI